MEEPLEDLSLFDRLSPLLLLRITPLNGYSHLRGDEQLVKILFEIYCSTNEIKELRRVAAEILARVNVDAGLVKKISSQLIDHIHQLDDLTSLKLGIYFLCNSLTIHSLHADSELWRLLMQDFTGLYGLLALPDDHGMLVTV